MGTVNKDGIASNFVSTSTSFVDIGITTSVPDQNQYAVGVKCRKTSGSGTVEVKLLRGATQIWLAGFGTSEATGSSPQTSIASPHLNTAGSTQTCKLQGQIIATGEITVYRQPSSIITGPFILNSNQMPSEGILEIPIKISLADVKFCGTAWAPSMDTAFGSLNTSVGMMGSVAPAYEDGVATVVTVSFNSVTNAILVNMAGFNQANSEGCLIAFDYSGELVTFT